MGYTVTALMALINREDGTTVQVMRGGPVPADVKDGHLQHLLSFGLVEHDGTDDAGPGPAADPVPDGPAPVKPKQVAPKDDWVAYAVAQGVAQAEAEALTKEQLVDRFKG